MRRNRADSRREIWFGVMVAALAYAGMMSSARAGEARCNDERKIGRDASDTAPIEVCYDQGLRGEATRAILANAERAARERLEKFDQECERLPGGRAVEVSVEPRVGTDVDWEMATDRVCRPVHVAGQVVCKEFQYPSVPFCRVSAKAEVKHKCVCN